MNGKNPVNATNVNVLLADITRRSLQNSTVQVLPFHHPFGRYGASYASDCVRNVGAYFDKHISMEHHIKSNFRAAYVQLYNIGKVRKYLGQQSAEKRIHALAHSHIWYI